LSLLSTGSTLFHTSDIGNSSGSQTGVKYSPGVICNSSGGNAQPKSQCCSILWAITAQYWG